MPPSYIKPYVKRGKNDAVDAEAICEAMSRPGMRFVPIKSAEQQATLMLHKTRELLVKQRTMSVNALRSHLSEFGIIIAKGIGRIDELLKLAEVDTTLPDAAKTAVKALPAILDGIEKGIDDLEGQIADAHARSDMNRLLARVPGVGKLIASVVTASTPDPSVFRSGRDFAAWLGLTPRQNSSGGKQKWLADHPRWTFHFTPTSASWLNAVEGFFATITRRKIRRGVFKSVAELEDAIMRYVKAHNKTSKPFVWTASASAIYEKLAKIPVSSE